MLKVYTFISDTYFKLWEIAEREWLYAILLFLPILLYTALLFPISMIFHFVETFYDIFGIGGTSDESQEDNKAL